MNEQCTITASSEASGKVLKITGPLAESLTLIEVLINHGQFGYDWIEIEKQEIGNNIKSLLELKKTDINFG